jgi:hypothetical protein
LNSKTYVARHATLCRECFVSKAQIDASVVCVSNDISSIPRNRIETWVCATHTLKSLGRPHLHIAIIKAQEPDVRKVKKIITKNLHKVVGGKSFVNVRNNTSADNPCVNAITYSWKNIENAYAFTHLNRYSDETLPLARTIFTCKAKELYQVMEKIVKEHQQDAKYPHNPCTTLELEVGDDEEVNETTFKSIEFGSQLQAIELVASYMREKELVINYDHTVWEKVKGSKMTYKHLSMPLDGFFHRVCLHYQEKTKTLEHQKDSVIRTLQDPGCDELLYSPIPRIQISYRMIELGDGFFDIINRCFYKNQTQHACWQYWSDIKINDIYANIENVFLNDKSVWWKTCNSCHLWYIEYLADLYDQLLPKIMYKYILSHVGENTDALIFLLTPLLDLFPQDMSCEIRNTITTAQNKRLEKVLGPAQFPESSKKLLKQHVDSMKEWKCTGMHPSRESIVTTEVSSCVRQHMYIADIMFKDKTINTIKDEIPHIILYLAMCSQAQQQNHKRLYKLPVYNTMPEYNNYQFNYIVNFLYSIQDNVRRRIEEPPRSDEVAFSSETITYKADYIGIINLEDDTVDIGSSSTCVEIPLITPIVAPSITPSGKKRGRPAKPKEEGERRSVGRPKKDKAINLTVHVYPSVVEGPPSYST